MRNKILLITVILFGMMVVAPAFANGYGYGYGRVVTYGEAWARIEHEAGYSRGYGGYGSGYGHGYGGYGGGYGIGDRLERVGADIAAGTAYRVGGLVAERVAVSAAGILFPAPPPQRRTVVYGTPVVRNPEAEARAQGRAEAEAISSRERASAARIAGFCSVRPSDARCK